MLPISLDKQMAVHCGFIDLARERKNTKLRRTFIVEVLIK